MTTTQAKIGRQFGLRSAFLKLGKHFPSLPGERVAVSQMIIAGPELGYAAERSGLLAEELGKAVADNHPQSSAS
jgi:hypothetical protein